ncbi:MAG TPA: hypothetical protein PLJ27_19890, partial [Polyangiaceae bacterium]|nr:hypothetical protein [Polyangiaceae bacterium]
RLRMRHPFMFTDLYRWARVLRRRADLLRVVGPPLRRGATHVLIIAIIRAYRCGFGLPSSCFSCSPF